MTVLRVSNGMNLPFFNKICFVGMFQPEAVSIAKFICSSYPLIAVQKKKKLSTDT